VTLVKICGLTTLNTAMAAVEAGADAVGFVFSPSPRRIDAELASSISADLPKGVDRFAVFYRPEPGQIESVLSVFAADVVQADHGFIPHGIPTRLVPVFRDGVDSEGSIDSYLAKSPDRRLLFEGVRSGVGASVDLNRASRLSSRSLLTLAGGLSPSNVAQAIAQVRPFAVDVSSGVESHRGVKDTGLIREFIESVRSTEKEPNPT
jgi:phosphoribosylanthranilate isomerase